MPGEMDRGKKLYRRLTGELEHAPEAAGCVPEVYQCVYWWTLLCFPVKPLGTYLVLPRRDCDDRNGDAEHCQAVKIPMVGGQVRRDYAHAFSVSLGLICGLILDLITWKASSEQSVAAEREAGISRC